MVLIYNAGLRIYAGLISLAALFNSKAKQWKVGRKHLFTNLQHQISTQTSWIWVHCASLGEFEQGRPIIEQLKQRYPQQGILLTFFSPSGYEIRKNYEFVDHVCYLPLDTAANAKRFLAIVRPSLAVFVKYEFWYHYLQELKKTETPTLLISAIFHAKQPFFHPLFGKFFQKILSCFSTIHVQNTSSARLLQSIGFNQFEVTGDTRIDRVLRIPLTAKQFPIIEAFRGEAFLLVAGSTWQPDEAILANFIQQQQNKNWKYLIVPHDISPNHIHQLQQKLKIRSWRYTQAEQTPVANWENIDVLILDTIGMLSQVYQYGKLAYIGGGFGRGIHNILEPAAFGLPVIIGPNYKKFEEANQLVDQKGCFSINNQVQFNEVFVALAKEDVYSKANQAITDYLAKNRGASKKAMASIQELLAGKATK